MGILSQSSCNDIGYNIITRSNGLLINGSYNKLINNTINGYGKIYGIRLVGDSHYNLISNSIITSVSNGIQIIGGGYNNISSCRITNGTISSIGIYIDENSTGTTITKTNMTVNKFLIISLSFISHSRFNVDRNIDSILNALTNNYTYQRP